MNEFYSGLPKKKKISADNKHEKFQMKGRWKGFFKKKNIMSMGEQEVKTDVAVQCSTEYKKKMSLPTVLAC